MSSIRKINSRPTAGGDHRRGTGSGTTSGRTSGQVTGRTPTGITGARTNPLAPLDYGVNNKLDNMYSSMLDHNAGNNEFAQLLSALGIDEDRFLNQDQRADWNKQLMNAQLQYYQDLEKRQYAQNQLNEQRIYDSPTNQLVRLMGAGVSRDAAIAMLSGQAGQPTIAESAVNTPGPSASESRNAGVERKLGIANTVLQGVSAVAGLVGLGFSIPQAIGQTHFLNNQNILTDSQIKAYQSTGKAYQVLKSIGASASAFGSVGSAIAAITKAAQNGNEDAIAYMQSSAPRDMYDNVSFASHAMSDMYHSERSSSDYAREYSNRMRAIEADTDLKEAQWDLVQEEILNAKATFEEIWSRIWLNDENQYGKFMENQYTESLQNTVDPITGQTGLQLMTAKTLRGLVNDFKILGYTNNEEYWQAQAKAILSDSEKVAAINTLLTWRNEADLQMCKQSPQTFRLACAIADCGIVEYANAISAGMKTESMSVSGGASGKFGKFGGSLNGSYAESNVTIDPNVINIINAAVNSTNAVHDAVDPDYVDLKKRK